jgi:hypothetical protein
MSPILSRYGKAVRVHAQLKSFTHVDECDAQRRLAGVPVLSGPDTICVNLSAAAAQASVLLQKLIVAWNLYFSFQLNQGNVTSSSKGHLCDVSA